MQRVNHSYTQVCAELGISERTFYRWKRRHGGAEVEELCQLRQLDEEHRKLGQVVADLTLRTGGEQWLVRWIASGPSILANGLLVASPLCF
ncbi:MAG: transposase [Candidatus Entotheonellia bacterium]